jgi:hypothetical protein
MEDISLDHNLLGTSIYSKLIVQKKNSTRNIFGGGGDNAEVVGNI